MLADAAHRFDEHQCPWHLRPDPRGVEDDRRPEGDEGKERPRRGVVDSLLLEEPYRRPDEQRAEERHRHQRAVETGQEVPGDEENGQERLEMRVLLAVTADGIAKLRLQIEPPRLRVRESGVLIAQIEIVIAHERLGHEEVVGLVPVHDVARRHGREHGEVDEQRGDGGAIGAPADVPRVAGRQKEGEDGELHDAEADESEPRVDRNAKGLGDGTEGDERRPQHAVAGEVAAQRPSAQKDERQRDRDGGEEREHHGPEVL